MALFPVHYAFSGALKICWPNRGVKASYETTQWSMITFGPAFANNLKRRRAMLADGMIFDE